MKILAIPASSSQNSINRQLLTYASRLIEDGLIADATVEMLDLNDYEMPIFSVDREQANGIHELAQQFFDKITAADAVIVSFAEHNGSYTAAWKNVYDWASRIDTEVYQGKKVAMFAATPGGRAGAGVLGSATSAAPFFGAELAGSLGVGTFYDTFDGEAGEIIDSDLNAQFKEILASLAS